MDSRQPACVWQQAVDAACVQQRVVVVACVQQRAAAVACVRQQGGVAGSMIAMGDSDGSGQPAAQLRWAVAVAVQKMVGWWQDCNGQRQR
jgi:hypothetical protein